MMLSTMLDIIYHPIIPYVLKLKVVKLDLWKKMTKAKLIELIRKEGKQ